MCSLAKIITLIVCVAFLQLRSAIAENCKFSWENGTEIENMEFGITLPWIEDTEKPGKELISLLIENVESIIDIISNSDSKLLFMKPTIENDSLVLRLTEDFENYAEHETKEIIGLKVNFKCVIGSKKVDFYQGINGTNRYDPEFVNGPYVYKVSMPLPINVDLSLLGNKIAARDVDLTNTNISFCLDATDPNVAGFSVSWSSMDSQDKKLHYATLVTTSVINFVEDITFALYATDVGKPPRTTKTSVTIQVDKANSILRFAKPLYIADLTNLDPNEANQMIIPFAGGPVTLESGDDETVTFVVKDEIGDYTNFETTVQNDRSVNIRLVDPPEQLFLESFVLLSLTAKKPGAEEKTVLHVSLPGLVHIPESSTTSTSTISSTLASSSPSSSLSTSTSSSPSSSLSTSTSSSPSSSLSTSPSTPETTSFTEPSENETGTCSPNYEDCDCRSETYGYLAGVIILGSALIASILLQFGLQEKMQRIIPQFVKMDKPETADYKKADFGIGRVGSNSSLGRSVGSNDTVEAINIAKL